MSRYMSRDMSRYTWPCPFCAAFAAARFVRDPFPVGFALLLGGVGQVPFLGPDLRVEHVAAAVVIAEPQLLAGQCRDADRPVGRGTAVPGCPG